MKLHPVDRSIAATRIAMKAALAFHNGEFNTVADAVQAFGSSRHRVERALRVVRNGSLALKKAVIAGQIPLGSGVRVSKFSIRSQKKVVAEMHKNGGKVRTKPRRVLMTPQLTQAITVLRHEVEIRNRKGWRGFNADIVRKKILEVAKLVKMERKEE